MNIPEAFYRVSAKALIKNKEGQFLLVKENTEYFNGWDMPGGGLDFGENPRVGIEREIKEEMGLEVLSISTQPVCFITVYIKRSKTWIANVFYEVEIKNLNFTQTNECEEIKFFSKEDVLGKHNEDIMENIIEFAKVK